MPSVGQLASEACQACRSDSPRLDNEEARTLLAALPNWRIVATEGVDQLQAAFTFADFAVALAFVNRVGALAEAADHHPRLTLEWGRVEVAWWTHTIGGLHRNDFIMAAHCEEALRSLASD